MDEVFNTTDIYALETSLFIDECLGLEANESYLVSGNDYEQNLDKWKPGESNVLFVTGLSGSGKSTIAKEYGNKFNATVIEIDVFEWGIDPREEKYMDQKFVSIYNKCKKAFPDYAKAIDAEWRKENGAIMEEDTIVNLLHKCALHALQLCKQDKSHLYIFEGIQIFRRFDISELKKEPLIIKGTSMITSVKQAYNRSLDLASKRNKNKDDSILDEVKMLAFRKRDQYRWHLPMDIKDEKRLNKFKKGIKS